MRSLFAVLLFCVAIGVAAATAPILHADSASVVPNQYIVILHQNTTLEIRDSHVNALRARLSNEFVEERIIDTYHFGEVIGYAAVLSKKNLALELNHPNVRYVEADQIVTAYADTAVVQTGATWGLDRIDQASLPLDGRYTYFGSAGTGVVAYVVDTGILISHDEFEGRAKFGVNYATGVNDDCNGHGTHVAGTIGGKVYGVAKKVTLVAVKVLNCAGSGTNANVVSGIQWTATDHKSRGTSARSVANLSLGGAASTTTDNAVTAAITAGVNFAVAAGNDNANACNYSPARVPGAITVGATASNDARSTFSNYGTCVDVFAPGTSITSAWIGSNTAVSTISGTSMASPHVAGVVAVHLGHLLADTPTAPIPSVATIHNWVPATGTANKVTNPGTGSPNVLLYSPSS